MKTPVIIYGGGGLGREILSLVRTLDDLEVIGFVDDFVKSGSVINGVKVLGGFESLKSVELPNIVFAIGNPVIKQKLVADVNQRYTCSCPTVIHPRAVIQDIERIKLGKGVVITAGAILTTNIDVGDHVLINLNATIGHDTRIKQYSSIMPGVNIAGEVQIGEAVLLGSGCNIMNRVSIGDYARVGMGAVVLENVESNETVVGVPARRVARRS